MSPVSTAILWLFTINIGLALGAGLYESTIMIPIWAATPPDTWIETGTRFWVFVTTIPLTLLTLASLVAAWMSPAGPQRTWWLTAAAIIVVERITTFGYFIPTMVQLMGSEPGPELSGRLGLWAAVDYGRHALSALGLLAALKALSLSGPTGSKRPA